MISSSHYIHCATLTSTLLTPSAMSFPPYKLVFILCCTALTTLCESLVSSPCCTSIKGLLQPTGRLNTALFVSELHIPGYRQSKLPFLMTEQTEIIQSSLDIQKYSPVDDYESMIPFESGFLLHSTTKPILTPSECQSIVDEAEYIASKIGWTTKRHGNYPTTDIPIVELPNTLEFLRRALVERIYPLLGSQFSSFLPNSSSSSIRVADGFVVKYDAMGQSELRPHRDGSVFSFNIALNPSEDFDGGGTWFQSLGDAVKIEQGHIVSHASGILHGGHGITRGKRYILVAFCIVEGYDSWSMRFYNKVRNN